MPERIYDSLESSSELAGLLLRDEEFRAAFSRPEESLGEGYNDEIILLGITSKRIILKYKSRILYEYDYKVTAEESNELISIPFKGIYQLMMKDEEVYALVDSTRNDSGLSWRKVGFGDAEKQRQIHDTVLEHWL